jgi:hypothetical protein
MPKYTITSNNGDGAERSDKPLEFRHTKAATDDAQIALTDMAREKMPNGKHAEFDISVEDDTGKEIYRAGMSFSAKDEGDLDREGQECDAAADDVTSCLEGGQSKDPQ